MLKKKSWRELPRLPENYESFYTVIMKGIILVLIYFLAFTGNTYSQKKHEKEVEAAVQSFKKGIIDADRQLLDALTSDQLVYGHSSGKVQNKAAFIEEIISLQPNDYQTIDLTNQTITVSGDVAVVRHIYSSEYKSNGENKNLRIGNMFIWQKKQGKWKLLARQAYSL
jgi:ketosteroid isomerase-like protein